MFMDILVIGLLAVNLAGVVALFLRKGQVKPDERVLERLTRLEGAIQMLISRQDDVRKETGGNLDRIRETVEVKISTLQSDNAEKLEKMRATVDEKLQATVEKRFNESFKVISGQLEQVYKGLGEMQTLATGVGDLKKVMEGVKTRGIYGEVQLGALLEDILTTEQYAENIITKKGTADRVEFAIKMPGKGGESVVYLPIDSKFPVENYSRLIEAYEKGDRASIEVVGKALGADVKAQAKKIFDKYIDPPATTDFGVMFVPTESLYAEILRLPGLFEEVRRKFRVTIVSPSTLTALLNSLMMGFRTLAIENRSSEVWEVLGAVKTQFGKFGDLLAKTKEKLEQTAKTIGDAEVKSRNIERKLRSVEELPSGESARLIGEIGVD
jgi:DNA recombination protein RmuC